MNRRTFLQRSILLAGAMTLDLSSFAEAVRQMGKPLLKIGILSDIHLRNHEDTAPLLKALEYFRDREADGVIIAGDMADFGLESQLQWVQETWQQVFPKNKTPDGRHVEKIFVLGNHDMEGHHMGTFRKTYPDKIQQQAIIDREAISNNPARTWQSIFKEKWMPIGIKEIKGYYFVAAQYFNTNETPGLETFLEKNKNILMGDKPFFYVQHVHPKDTCSAPWVWGHDNGKSTQLLSRFPNAVSFTGHSHTTLTDERTIWQGDFTSVGTASLSYLIPFNGRENTSTGGSRPGIAPQMPKISCQDGKQGQFMTVYDDCITLERHDFVYDQQLGDNWVLPLPNGREKPLSFDVRAKKAKAPQFAAGDKVTVSSATGKDRNDKEQAQITVHFPTVLKKRTGMRAFDYEVQAEVQDLDTHKIALTKRVFSKGYYLAESQDEDEAVCVFSKDELPDDCNVRFIVRPYECFGKHGNPIYSNWLKI